MAVTDMSERGAIENAMVLYTEALDGGAFETLGELFEHGSVTIEGGPHSGRQASGAHEVADLYRSIVALDPDLGLTGTRHFITNIFIEIDGAGRNAIARSYFAVTQQTAALPLQLVACGGYHDRFEVIAAQWRFRARRIVCDQVGNLSQHMLS
ncbi:MAG TPA: nuclear transport factor 2 family protein [Acidimicrobiales bacterium]|nr:nuclear transport factor 2 family protein [Acidimicrobiales bacterium]